MSKDNLYKFSYTIDKDNRNKLNGHNSFVIWLTGLSGAGKSTLANKLDQYLHLNDIHSYILNGDNVRKALNGDLGFTEEERDENIRRVSEVAKLFVDAGFIVITSFISPLQSHRDLAKELIGEEFFKEVHINTSFKECEKRDTKGLYKLANEGKIKDFTGFDSPFEAPKNPDFIIETENKTVLESSDDLWEYVANLIKYK